jgi:hypothetical protein
MLTFIYIVFSDVLFHIGRYGTYHAKPDAKNLAREKYYTLFEALFEPYYNSPPRDNPEHRKDLNEILDKAVKYGMTVLRRTTSVIEERWGDRPDKIITDRPGLYCCFSRGRRWCGVKSWFKVAARTRGLPLLRLEDRVWSLDDKFPMGRIRGSFDFER